MLRRGVLLVGTAGLIACGDGEGPNISGVPGSLIASLEIQPGTDTLFVPDTIRATDRVTLTVKATARSGASMTIPRFVWATEDSSVAVVDSLGVVRPTGLGTTTISASASRVATATIVVLPIINRVTLRPVNDTLFVDDPITAGDSVRIQGAAVDTAGQRISGVRLRWSSASPTVATVDSSGLVRATGLGTTGITVRSLGGAGTGSISVVPLLKSVTVTDPAVTRVLVGDSVRLVATARNYADAVISRRFVWTTLTPSVATVDTIGTVRFTNAGNASIAASSAFRSDTSAFAVFARELQTVDVGYDYACGVGLTGRAWCWGKGHVGQLGTAADSTCFDDLPSTGRIACTLAPKPVQRPDVSFTQIAAGDSTACGISSTQQLYCWGDDTFGQIGNGSGGGGSTPRLATVGSERFTVVAVGSWHACALNLQGAAYCWGRDSSGQLGTNRRTNSTTPVPVTGPGGDDAARLRFTAITVGQEHTCAIATGGAVWCWGKNVSGTLGDTALVGDAVAPVPVRTTARFVQISAGQRHTCGVTETGDVYCWGNNSFRQAGDASQPFVALPQLVISGVRSITAGREHTCILSGLGRVDCWGNAGYGQLGRGDPNPNGQTHIAAPVAGGIAFASVSAGRRSTCGVDTAGATWCWGSNMLGALGNQLQAAISSSPQRLAPLR